jgi:hypothetical protein
MSNATEYTKANMASAAVLLGLTLVILATLGSSTTELSLLSSHRPVLAFLLVLGSPAVNPIRTYDYPDPKVEVREKKWRWDFPKHSQIPKRSQTRNIVCVIVELFFAIGSVANLAELCRTIALNTIAVMSCDFSDVVVEFVDRVGYHYASEWFSHIFHEIQNGISWHDGAQIHLYTNKRMASE